jgi:hypothetical protein
MNRWIETLPLLATGSLLPCVGLFYPRNSISMVKYGQVDFNFDEKFFIGILLNLL